VSRVVQDLIGEQLRVVYDDLRDEPAPDRLLDLLKQLGKPQPDEG
jgi:hypothetical protein